MEVFVYMPLIELWTMDGHGQHCYTFTRQSPSYYTTRGNLHLVFHNTDVSVIFRSALISKMLNPLTPNDHYSGRTAPLTSKRYILYIYSTNIGTEYFKHGIYYPFFLSSSKCSLCHNYNVFGSRIIHILFTGVLKLKKNSGAKRLNPFRVTDSRIRQFIWK